MIGRYVLATAAVVLLVVGLLLGAVVYLGLHYGAAADSRVRIGTLAEALTPTADGLQLDPARTPADWLQGYAWAMVLDDDGRVKEVWAAHDSGKVVNPISIQGQIEGGVLMGLGYALTEDFPLKDCVPQAKFGTLGLMRADQIPDIHAIYVEKKELLPFAYGAKGIGEIATIPTAPAVQGAYYARDHVLRTALPMQDTFYRPASKGK